MFYACIPLFSYMGTTLDQMPAAAAITATVAAAARDSSRRPGYGTLKKRSKSIDLECIIRRPRLRGVAGNLLPTKKK